MDDLTKYYLGWGLGGLAVLAVAGYMVYSYQGSLRPESISREKPEVVAPQVVPKAPEASSKGVVRVEDGSEGPPSYEQRRFLLPQTDEEGTPFVLTDASEHANRGFKLMRQKKFDEAVNEYRLAYNLDPRYETHLKRTEDLVKEIRRSGFDVAKTRRVYPGERLTYKDLYDWD